MGELLFQSCYDDCGLMFADSFYFSDGFDGVRHVLKEGYSKNLVEGLVLEGCVVGVGADDGCVG